jgi:hypothetical protein
MKQHFIKSVHVIFFSFGQLFTYLLLYSARKGEDHLSEERLSKDLVHQKMAFAPASRLQL